MGKFLLWMTPYYMYILPCDVIIWHSPIKLHGAIYDVAMCIGKYNPKLAYWEQWNKSDTCISLHRNIQTIKWKHLALNLAVIEYIWALPLGYRTLGQTITYNFLHAYEPTLQLYSQCCYTSRDGDHSIVIYLWSFKSMTVRVLVLMNVNRFACCISQTKIMQIPWYTMVLTTNPG